MSISSSSTNSYGKRKLQGRERDLFVTGTLNFLKHLDENPDLETGIEPFDRLPEEDRPAIILWVSAHLLDDRPAPIPAAWMEATLLAVFNHICINVHEEIHQDEARSGEEEEDSTYYGWRNLVHEAWMERCRHPEAEYDEDEGPNQCIFSTHHDGWCRKVHDLDTEILEDRDCLDDSLLDLHPTEAAKVRQYLGIPESYFMSVPPAIQSHPGYQIKGALDLLVKFYPYEKLAA